MNNYILNKINFLLYIIKILDAERDAIFNELKKLPENEVCFIFLFK
jgi:hypothetical protein